MWWFQPLLPAAAELLAAPPAGGQPALRRFGLVLYVCPWGIGHDGVRLF